ncbi:MAG: glycosyltransferase family 4 protein [Candidatus Moranbacteria bacterium]|nr:glycosyltransferase family 4 protein [Candidatus Moranbacteria bacterium]
MKIIFLNYEYPPLGGGAANATKHILKEYASFSDVEIDLVTSASDNKKSVEKISKNVTIHYLPIGDKNDSLNYQSPKDLLIYSHKALWYGYKLMKKGKHDLIHAFFTVPCGVLAYTLAKRFRVPYIVSLRGADVPGFSDRFTLLYHLLRIPIRFIWKRAEAVVSNSDGLKELAHETLPQQEISIIKNGVDTTMFHQRARGLSKEGFVIICAARLSRRKGFKYAVEAFEKIHQKHPTARLMFVGGEGDAAEDLHGIVQKEDLNDVVTFTGHVAHEEMPGYYHQAHVFLLPSLNEGMSNNLLEAMASGLPIIMTPTGGAKELIEEEKNGFLVPMKDAKAIEEKIEIMISRPDLREEMGQESRRRAEALSWKNVAKEYRDLYKKTITHKK